MKKFHAKVKTVLCLALALLFLMPALPAAAAVQGDMDGDGVVTGGDARTVLRFAVLLEAPTTAQRALADLDGDNAITSADARLTLRLAVGLGKDFAAVLYSTAHQYDRRTADELPPVDSWIENIYRQVGKWCCYYTVHDVFRPALRTAGYSEARINQLAPNSFDGNRVRKALENAAGLSVPSILLEFSNSVYIPSLLADYYLSHSQYCTTYIFAEYYDDVLDQVVYCPSENRWTYQPEVGDILFASNKTSTYYMDYPTIDHTAQIIRVYDDGSFLCTDGCILNDGSDEPCVREREYVFNASRGMYEYKYNDVVKVLMIAKPML